MDDPLSPFSFRCGSLLVYLPKRFTSPTAVESQNVMTALKGDRINANTGVTISTYIARRMAAQRESLPFGWMFGESTTFVPAPSSGVYRSDVMWPTHRIAVALAREGLGVGFSACIKRVRPSRKAATSPSGQRPTVAEHLATMEIAGQIPPAHGTIVVVDDILTEGNQLASCVALLRQVSPDATIAALSVMRTMQVDCESVLDPWQGWILYGHGFAFRRDGSDPLER